MVVLLLLILHTALGFNPASMLKTFIVGIAAVACFMAIMYFFNLLLGKVGSFLMLLFMVLQLAGSAGTYPVEISGSLAQALHKWMPFTYSVDGFRSAIAQNGPSIVPECVVLFSISIVFTLLTIVVFAVRAKRTLEHKPFVYEWIEEKGLA
jgi:putative membrane protein